MLVRSSEFSFDLEYIPEKKNVIADYGTRHIPDTDWPVQPDDPLKLNSLFPFNNSFTSIKFPNIQRHIYFYKVLKNGEKILVTHSQNKIARIQEKLVSSRKSLQILANVYDYKENTF